MTHESPPIFKSKWLDACTRASGWSPLIIFIPIITFLIWFSWQRGYSVAYITGWFSVGILGWSLLEYTVHRTLFHWKSDNRFVKAFVQTIHGVHHDYPNDPKRLVMVPIVTIPGAALTYGEFYFVFGHAVAPFIAGGFFGYMIYDTMHYLLHHFNWSNSVFKALKRHHMHHHFKDPDSAYGVSSTLWDLALGTRIKKS